MKLAKGIAKTYENHKNYSGAREALETVFMRYPRAVSFDDVTFLIDILLATDSHAEGLQALQSYAGVTLKYQVTK